MSQSAKPDFIDNREGNTLAQALKTYLGSELATRREPPRVWIATSYFNPEGFPLVADELEQAREVRILIGADPGPRPLRARRAGEKPEDYQAAVVDEALRRLKEGLEEDRNLLGFTEEVEDWLQRLVDFLRRPTTQVRIYRRQFLHGKAIIFPDGEGVLVGSSNFTPGGLKHNLELNIGRYDPQPVGKVVKWFEDLWEEAEEFDLAAIYQARFEPYEPYLIYLRMLLELYGHEREKAGEEGLPLTDFQRDGLLRAKRILDKYGGVLIADGVGLGKTYIGGELIRETIYKRRQRALLIAPAALRDGTWKAFFDRHAIHCDAISYEELAKERRLGGNGGTYLSHAPEEYSLIVIDEAQAFRNPGTRRADALRRLLASDPAKQVVMLSATPVNNSLWDLYWLLSYFIRNDGAFAERGIMSLRERFEDASRVNPRELKPDVLFDVLDAVCVRRTRRFIKKWYPNAQLEDGKGNLVPVRFPTPVVRRVDYDFEAVLPGIFDELKAALAPEEGQPRLTMARYAPSRYRLQLPEEKVEAYEVQLVGLLRSALLKRFESSVHAFRRTLEKMKEAHYRFLELLDQGYVVHGKTLAELEDVDSDEALNEVLEAAVKEGKAEPAAEYDVEKLRREVEHDIEVLSEFLAASEPIQRRDDPKLQALAEELRQIVWQAREDSYGEKSERDNRKVIIFSYYADTVDWIEGYLSEVTREDEVLACYAGRIASVTSDDSRGGVSRKEAIWGFAPDSTDAPDGTEDRYDILICTDVLAEGMNLQQCRHVINFDLPWNPMRIVQRNGRIDRIGSHHKKVYAHCFFPDRRLDELLELEERIQQKMHQAAASIGVESPPVPGAPVGERTFAETREEIERLRQEQADLLERAGEDVAVYSGEEYRQELRSGLEKYGQQLRALPWGAGSGYRARGKRRGWVFCARVDERVFLRFVPAEEGGEVDGNIFNCLRQITCEEDTARCLSEEMKAGVYEAWRRARGHILEQWMRATDPKNLQPRVPRIFREMAEHLRRYPPLGMSSEAIDEIVDKLEAPWPGRIENAFREFYPPDDPDRDPREVSRQIVDCVNRLGLYPYRPPDPWPPIDEDQIHLVCWLAVDSGSEETSAG
ncbi:MAG: helicase [Armatimonadetes bacterium]|nr:helicase [Armatimonadota bacterium]